MNIQVYNKTASFPGSSCHTTKHHFKSNQTGIIIKKKNYITIIGDT
jgi:hypothetical protein